MTEKIIDGIDVNECEFYGYEGICKLYSGSVCSKDCSNYPNCNYKQLNRKEQKLEKIKEIVSHCKEQTGCIGCKYENECDASYNFNNWILKIIEGEENEK